MDSVKYIDIDVHKDTISIVVLNSDKVVECVIETKASTILQFFQGLSGSLHVPLKKAPGLPGCMTC